VAKLDLKDRLSLKAGQALTTNIMGEYANLVQAYDPERNLLLILTPDIVEVMYTARSGSSEYLAPLDSWVDQFLKQYVSHMKFIVHQTLKILAPQGAWPRHWMMIVYHTLLPSFIMPSCTSDRSHTWALAELDLPQNMMWYSSSEYVPDQQFVTEDVSTLLISIFVGINIIIIAHFVVFGVLVPKATAKGEGSPSI
jgi:hypothetical protein